MCMLKTPDDVDFRIMSTFVEFYSIMLGFVNYKSYQDIGLIYPPKLSITNTQTDNKVKISTGTQNDFNEDYLSSLNCDFLKIVDEPDGATNGDVFSAVDEEDPEILEKAKLEQEALKKLQSLFKGLRFFLNREVPREQFVFAIRCFSGEVSWDKNTALGSTYQEEDESITHQIIDRNHTGKNNLNRIYVQPQWVFDCINESMLLPVEDYLPGTCLPPHLSPFSEATATSYVPPEKQRLINMKLGIPNEGPNKKVTDQPAQQQQQQPTVKTDTKKVEAKKQVVAPEGKKNGAAAVGNDEDLEDNGMRVDLDSPGEESVDEETEISESEDEAEKKAAQKPKQIKVVKGKPQVQNMHMMLKKATDEEKKLSEMMIPKKHKRLYNKIMYSEKKTRQETNKLKEKRERYEAKNKK